MCHNNQQQQHQQQNTEINAARSMEVNEYDGYDYQQASIFAEAIENFKSLTPSSSQSSGYRLNFANGNSSSQERYHRHQLVMSSGSQVLPLSQQTEIERRVAELNDHRNFSESSANYTSDNYNNTNSTATSTYYHQDNGNDENQNERMSPTTLAPSLSSSPCPSEDVCDRAADLTCGHQNHKRDYDVSAHRLKEDIASLMPIFLQYLFDIGKSNQHDTKSSSQQQQQQPHHGRRQPLGNQSVLINRRHPHDLNAIYYHHRQSSSPPPPPLSSGVSSLSSSPRDIKPSCKFELLVTVDLDPNGELSLDSCSIVRSDEMRGNDIVSSIDSHQKPKRLMNVCQQEHDMKPAADRQLEKLQKRKSAPRVRKTASQVILLEAALEEGNYLNQDQRKTLAKRTGLSDCQIRLWFQYRRNKATRARAATNKKKM